MKILSLLIVLLMHQTPSFSKVVVVVSKDSDIEQLSIQQVSNIFLAKTNRFPNGEKVTPIELKNNGIRTKFYHSITGKSENQLNAYWTTLVFTGKGKPPKALSSTDKLMMQLIKKNGAISYMLSSELTDDMKVVYTFP